MCKEAQCGQLRRPDSVFHFKMTVCVKASRFVCAVHRSLLANSEEGGEAEEHLNLKHNHLISHLILKFARLFRRTNKYMAPTNNDSCHAELLPRVLLHRASLAASLPNSPGNTWLLWKTQMTHTLVRLPSSYCELFSFLAAQLPPCPQVCRAWINKL